MPTVNQQLAVIFQEMADVIKILGGDPFRSLAFEKIARSLDVLETDIAKIGPDVKKLSELEGIGKGSAARIAEFLQTGKIKDHEELLSKFPPSLRGLLRLPGMGPKTIALLWKECGVKSVEDLREKLKTDELCAVKGLGPKKIEAFRKSLAFADTVGTRERIGRALPIAQWFVEQLRKFPGVKQAAYAGSLRRGKETIGDIDLIVASNESDAAGVSDAFVKLGPVNEVLGKGPTKTSIRTRHDGDEGIQVDLRVVSPSSYGAALLYFTGSKEHNIALRERAIKRGMKLNEYALTEGDKIVAGKTEEEVYKALGLAWIPPELREDNDEIALADLKTDNTSTNPEETISAYINKELEFQAFETIFSEEEAQKYLIELRKLLDGHERANYSNQENLILYVEDRLMLDFPDPENPKLIAPFFNRTLPKDKPENLKGVWDSLVPSPLQGFHQSILQSLKKNKWLTHEDSRMKKPGVYVFRERQSKKIVYVGSAGRRGGEGIQDRLKLHLRGSIENSSFRKHIGQWFRDKHGEITRTARGQLPKLIEIADIKSELHAHTTASDGSFSIRELAMVAYDHGFHTIAVTDHSKSQVIANGLSVERLEQHIEDVRAVAAEMKGKINILAGSEVDILADGTLDYPNSVLKELDIVVASPHAALSQEPAKATKRLIKAIQNPYVTIMGHPTGRLVNRREGLHPDIHEIIAAAKERGIALEINANHHRLDLRDTHARLAIESGVVLAIDTDAHGLDDFTELVYGVLTARRAGATAQDVINCLSREALMKWLAGTRS